MSAVQGGTGTPTDDAAVAARSADTGRGLSLPWLRSFTYPVTVAVELFFAGFNLVLALEEGWHRQGWTAGWSSAIALGCMVGAWTVTWAEQRIRTVQTRQESLMREQLLDEEIKTLMAKVMREGGDTTWTPVRAITKREPTH